MGIRVEQTDVNSFAKVFALSGATDNRLIYLEEKVADLLYVPIEITSFTNGTNIVEQGSTVTSVDLKWEYNNAIIQGQKIQGQLIDLKLRTTTIPLNTKENTKITLEAADDRNRLVSKTTSITFLNGRYFGVSSDTSNVQNIITSLTKELTESYSKTFTVNCGENQYIYFAYPARLGNANDFKVNGFSGGFNKISTTSFTNSSGFTEDYIVYRSANPNLGKTTVNVS